jgi:hypothetical protein
MRTGSVADKALEEEDYKKRACLDMPRAFAVINEAMATGIGLVIVRGAKACLCTGTL